jgi:hypothetical protein
MYPHHSATATAMRPSFADHEAFFGAAGLPYDDLTSAAVLPEQFFHPFTLSTGMSGHIVLRWAVLLDAFNVLTRPSKKKNRRHTQRLLKETSEWFFSDDTDWPFSFVNICSTLGLDPEYIRRGLRQSTQSEAAPRPRRRRYVGRSSLPLAA